MTLTIKLPGPDRAEYGITCDTCGAIPGDPCRQVGPGVRSPPPPEKLGRPMTTFHAIRRRRAHAGELD